MKLSQPSTIFKLKNNHKVSCDYIFCMNFFTTSNSKSIIAALRIVTIEKSELTFLLYYISITILMYYNCFADSALNFLMEL